MIISICNTFNKIKEKATPLAQKIVSFVSPTRTVLLAFSALAVYFTSLTTESPLHEPVISTAVAASVAWTLANGISRKQKKLIYLLGLLASAPWVGMAHMQTGYHTGSSNAPIDQAKVIFLGDAHALTHLSDTRAQIANQFYTPNSIVLVEGAESGTLVSTSLCNTAFFNAKADLPLRCEGWDDLDAHRESVEIMRQFSMQVNNPKNSKKMGMPEYLGLSSKFNQLCRERDRSLIKAVQKTLKQNYDRIFVISGTNHIHRILPEMEGESYHALTPSATPTREQALSHAESL